MGKRLLYFLQRFAVVTLIPGVALLVVACGANATTNPSSPVITSTVKARPSPTPALSEVVPPRKGGSLAYDGTTGMDLLFGGAAGPPDGYLNDTWVWNGQTWLPLHPVTSPPPRNGASMVYDAATGTVVLFGGVSPTATVLGDTWTWDGSTWTEQSSMPSPGGGYTNAAYDAARQYVLVLATTGGKFQWRSETWIWTGTLWKELG